MRVRNRRDDRARETPSSANAPAAGMADGERWLEASRLIAEGDEAIDRALGRDSQAFLDSNRQEGGQ